MGQDEVEGREICALLLLAADEKSCNTFAAKEWRQIGLKQSLPRSAGQ